MAKRVGLTKSRVVRAISPLLGLALAFAAASAARADWWSENFELHGKANSTVYFNAPSLSKDFQMDQWMNSIEMNFDVKLYQDSDLDVSFHGIVTPTYDAVYDVYPDYFGDRRRPGGAGSQNLVNAHAAMTGDNFPGSGVCINGGFCDTAADTSNFFTGKNNPQFVFDDTIFFGILGAASRTRGDDQPKLGGNSKLSSWDHAEATLRGLGLTGATSTFLNSLDQGSVYLAGLGASEATPIHSFGGNYFIGDRGSIDDQAPYGINHTDGQLSTRCFDGVHDWCWAREAYFEIKYKDTQVRMGRQQVVWGKTDAFRLQDLVNPIDFSSHNVYPSLEERRIPSLSIDLIHSFGKVGPLEDFSLELVWVVDRFKPLQVGQCGDFWAFTAACEGRADVGGCGDF